VLAHREIDLPEQRAAHVVARRVSERLRDVGGRNHRIAIEPVVDVLVRFGWIRIAAQVGSENILAAEILRDAGHQRSRRRRIGKGDRFA